MMGKIILFLILTLHLFSCEKENRILDKNEIIQSRQWSRDSVYSFTCDILDTSVSYDLFFNIRNSVEYPYQNIFVLYTIEDANDNLLNSYQKDITIFDNFGKPLGNNNSLLGVNFGKEYYSYHKLNSYKFPEIGQFKISVSHQMRDKRELKGVLSVGMEITK